MTDLSPAALAIVTAQAKERCLFEWSAVNDPPCHPSDAGWNGCGQCVDRRGIAAALRAAVEIYSKEGNGEGPQWFLDIAAELEGGND